MTLYPFIRSLKTGLSVARVYPPSHGVDTITILLQIEGGQQVGCALPLGLRRKLQKGSGRSGAALRVTSQLAASQ